ncbi:hypothetical protein EIP91_006347 [Steccherinum ochraceum]|uniref:Uncharacterized protein n=1 Tax=Steccherinum ochraceum TaxID=92696 RepID=A0A4R0RKI8_9APHY|nr:hypothetical protein EIP91_006347 [Steccherinum ochraceum]
MASKQPRDYPVIQKDLTGQTIIVTGCNVGLGLEAAKHFARMRPHKLIGTCRSEDKCAQAEQEIKKETGFDDVVCWPLELTSFASVKAFVDRFERETDGRLDVLLLNAGIVTFDYILTADGHESTVQVNHLSGALLSYLLLPALLRTGEKLGKPSRLAIVTSYVHDEVDFGSANFSTDMGIIEKLDSKEFSTKENMVARRYRESKLLNVIFARKLQSHLASGSPLIVNSVDPGFCVSRLRRTIDNGQFEELLQTARTTEEGSRQLILAAIGPRNGSEDPMRGAYVKDNEIREPHSWSSSDEGREVEERVWTETLRIASEVDKRVEAVVIELKL